MRLNKIRDPHVRDKGSARGLWRQLIAVALSAALTGCASNKGAGPEAAGGVEGFLGEVAADEPQAALIGRDTLASGGNAIDAAVAMYFVMAVTLPSQASLGGGGVCIAFDPKTGEVRALDFLARAPKDVSPDADRPTAIPGNARGFYALHGRYGKLRWSQLIAPAENLARFGIQVSRAFASDIKRVEDALAAEPEMRRVFGVTDGSRLVGEGDSLRQLDLAAVLARIRVNGPGDFYEGTLSEPFVRAVRKAGGSLSREDLAAYQPMWRETISVPMGNEMAHFAPPPAMGGAVAAQMWAMLVEGGRYRNAKEDERPHLIAETALRAYGDQARWTDSSKAAGVMPQVLVGRERIGALMASYRRDRHVPLADLGLAPNGGLKNPAAASLIAVGRDGSAAACTVTLNSLFGTGRVGPGIGIVLASMPGPGGRGATALGPMVVVNPNVKEFHFAAAASGGVAAAPAMVEVAARTLLQSEPLPEALAAKRVLADPNADRVYAEQGLSPSTIEALTRRGHRVIKTPLLGRVDAAACPSGLPPKPETCRVGVDPRGFGLAVGAE